MNKAEFKAIKMIAEKLNWESVNLSTIMQMVRNQQSLELDTVGECDDDEVTLLSLATRSKDKIVSTMYVFDYLSLANWNFMCACEDFGYTPECMNSMLDFYDLSQNYLAECYEAEDSFALMASEYNDADWHDFYNYGVYMGWF